MPALAQGDVIGRDEELAEVDEVLSALHAGPAGIVLVGDAGVGKTTLWRAGIEAARVLGYHVLETARPRRRHGLRSRVSATCSTLSCPTSSTRAASQADALASRSSSPPDRPAADERAVAVAC